MSFDNTVPERFLGQDYYQILGVLRDATTKEISSAYRRAALKYHPDHNKSPEANAEFNMLAKIHQTLSDKKARKFYDETGQSEFDQAGEMDGETAEDEFEEYLNYWRSVFPKVTENDIERYKLEYIGSQEELEDIEQAYAKSGGDLKTMFEYIPYSDLENVDRIVDILRNHFGVKYTSAQVKKLKKQLDKFESSEAAEAEEWKKYLPTNERRLMAQNPENDMNTLASIIQSRQQKRGNFLDYMEEKYSKPPYTKRR